MTLAAAASPDALPEWLEATGKYALSVEGTKARFSDCEQEDFRELLDRGAKVQAMSFQLEESLDFVLDDQLRLKSIKDLTVPDADSEPCFASEALLTQSLITRAFLKMVKALGGEAVV
jgi:DNA recombination-dependent growth factor C